MNTAWSQVAVHGVHVLAAVTAVGGAIFLRLVLMPSAEASLDPVQHDLLRAQMLRRWKILVMICITLLLLTGLYTFFTVSMPKAKVTPGYHAWFGVKVLMALGVFFIASALTGRAEVFAPMRAKAKLWLTLNVVLGVLTILLGGILANLAPGH